LPDHCCGGAAVKTDGVYRAVFVEDCLNVPVGGADAVYTPPVGNDEKYRTVSPLPYSCARGKTA